MTYFSFILILMAAVMHTDDVKIYSVKKIRGTDIVVTGKGDSPHWKQGTVLTDFQYPWENKRSTTTSFKALHSDGWLYCLYEVGDDNVNVYVKTNHKEEVANSDRVEIFFRKDDRLSPYYGLELDPDGRVMDYEAEYHRKFNGAWSWPKGGLIVKASRTNGGYKVECAISKESLHKLGLLKGNKIEAGIFRGDCVALNGDEATISWISWMKPKSETPDFHIPSAFGNLLLEE